MSAATARLAGRVRTLLRLRPGSKDAEQARYRIERDLMRLLTVGGQRAVESLVRALQQEGRQLVRADMAAPLREWREALEDGREWTLRTLSGSGMRSVHVGYRKLPPPPTPRQQKIFDLQEAFYARYNRVAQHAYSRKPAPRLSKADRLVLLLGEFEADWNNGGFDQYLGNKGLRRARAALGALEKVGARRAASMLSSAIESSASPEKLEALDDRYHRSQDDLALLAMKHLAR